ncbi:gamma-glutamyltranspeptidase 1-like isoform X4, partial [Leptotrombidium deliense]
APGKRPISSMCPSIFVDRKTGNAILVIGGSGGTMITSGSALVALRHLMFDETIKSAIDAPRLHHQLMPDHISFESNFPQNILKKLELIGHKVKLIEDRGSVIEAIGRDKNGKITANSDFRKGGSIDGY